MGPLKHVSAPPEQQEERPSHCRHLFMIGTCRVTPRIDGSQQPVLSRSYCDGIERCRSPTRQSEESWRPLGAWVDEVRWYLTSAAHLPNNSLEQANPPGTPLAKLELRSIQSWRFIRG